MIRQSMRVLVSLGVLGVLLITAGYLWFSGLLARYWNQAATWVAHTFTMDNFVAIAVTVLGPLIVGFVIFAIIADN